jgi:hypothetical protein
VPIVALTVMTGALSLVNFTWPVWTPARSVARIAINATSSVIFFVLMRSGRWLIAKEGAALPDGTSSERIALIANKSVEIGIVIALIISLIEIARERTAGSRGARSRRRPIPAAVHSFSGLERLVCGVHFSQDRLTGLHFKL